MGKIVKLIFSIIFLVVCLYTLHIALKSTGIIGLFFGLPACLIVGYGWYSILWSENTIMNSPKSHSNIISKKDKTNSEEEIKNNKEEKKYFEINSEEVFNYLLNKYEINKYEIISKIKKINPSDLINMSNDELNIIIDPNNYDYSTLGKICAELIIIRRSNSLLYFKVENANLELQNCFADSCNGVNPINALECKDCGMYFKELTRDEINDIELNNKLSKYINSLW